MKILILGAAGQVSKILIDRLLKNTQHDLVLYAREADERLDYANNPRVKIISGDFTETEKLIKIMETGIDYIYLNDSNETKSMSSIISAMEKTNTKKIIVASVLDIHDEVKGQFAVWNNAHVTDKFALKHKATAKLVEESELEYTIIRLPWLYNQADNFEYILTNKGEDFIGTQITREAVAKFIEDVIENKDNKFSRTSIGISEPNTEFDKPSFY
ncbi:NAD(P)H-binding protein [Mesoplasma photuris]|uniref:NAD(P)H-binding protein n=1 Tax=Mesoplasma photuris TaxID=217731 RepID=UPI0004E1430F|nr:NAD(P)H-binding protein [Mesoplasma photuris]